MVVTSVYHVGTHKKISKNSFRDIGNFMFCNNVLPSQKMLYANNGSIQVCSIHAPSIWTVHFLFSHWCQFLEHNAQQRIASFKNKKKCQRTTLFILSLVSVFR